MKKIFLVIMIFIAQESNSGEWGPHYYHHAQNGQRPQMTHAIEALPKLHLKGDESILEIGCGDGEMANYIAHHCLASGSLHGIDISHSMIAAAQQNHASQNVTFEHISLFDYRSKQPYDAIVCFWVLYLFDDYAAALKQLTSFLKPGGKALICHLIDPSTPFFQLLKNSVAPEQMPLRFPTLETIIAAIRNTPVSIEYIKVKYNYDRHATFEAFLAGMQKLPLFDGLLQSLGPDFYAKLLELYSTRADGFVYDYAHVITMVLEKNE